MNDLGDQVQNLSVETTGLTKSTFKIIFDIEKALDRIIVGYLRTYGKNTYLKDIGNIVSDYLNITVFLPFILNEFKNNNNINVQIACSGHLQKFLMSNDFIDVDNNNNELSTITELIYDHAISVIPEYINGLHSILRKNIFYCMNGLLKQNQFEELILLNILNPIDYFNSLLNGITVKKIADENELCDIEVIVYQSLEQFAKLFGTQSNDNQIIQVI